MFFSVIQTLVCVLLVNGGLYALHLTGNSNGPSMAQQTSNNNQPHNTNPLSKTSSNPYQSTNNRLNEELADLAQLERERLMVMGLVKQTAEESGYHGRPIITGRIKMHPAEDIDSDYSAWLSQQARNAMFGSVVTQPLNDEEDYDTGGGGGVESFDPLRSQNKYEYGRVVQPVEREREFENPHNLNLDDFMELEPANEEEDMFPDLDGYAYIDELMAEENKERLQHHYQQQQQIPQFPGFRPHLAQQHQQHQQHQQQHQQHSLPLTHSYQNQEPLDNTQTLKEFFEKEQLQKLQNSQKLQQHPPQHPPQHPQQHQQQLQQQHQSNPYNPKYRNDIRMQQKWLRKRNQLQQQQQEQLPRNIFGQKNSKQLHHFRTLNNNKLAMANSEATATTRVNNNNKSEQQQQDQQHQEKDITKEDSKKSSQSSSSSSSSSSSPNTTKKSDKSLASSLIEPKADLLLHPNHKRSGLTPASLASTQGVSSPHSLASQLMLRTARGQRQYDVPQIECPTAMDGMERFACPTPDVQGRYRCIDDHVLCDGFIDCPEGEDEDRRSCMFYKTTKAHLDVLADALLRWARGR